MQTPVRSPNAEAFAESWIAGVKRECLDYFACFSLRHADYLVQAYVDFCNAHRPHLGLGNRPIVSMGKPLLRLAQTSIDPGSVGCLSELGGLLKNYYRRAA